MQIKINPCRNSPCKCAEVLALEARYKLDPAGCEDEGWRIKSYRANLRIIVSLNGRRERKLGDYGSSLVNCASAYQIYLTAQMNSARAQT